MSLNSHLANMFSSLKNCRNIDVSYVVTIPSNSLSKSVLNVLKERSFILDYSTREVRKNVSVIDVRVKFRKNGSNVIEDIKMISKPGCRLYRNFASIKLMIARDPARTFLISTSKGVMTGFDALEHRLGGEVLCKIF